MTKSTIYGGKELNGEISINASKNAALPILCASLLNKGKTKILNLPKIDDINQLLSIFSYLNINYSYKDTFQINPTNFEYKTLAISDVTKFRASYYLIGVFLYLFDKCEINTPGGCNLGNRPLNYHLEAFKKMGYKIEYDKETIKISREYMTRKITYKLEKPSVGATINIILAGLKSGVTIINYAKEPEVIDTINFLNKMGCNIYYKDNLYVMPSTINKNIAYSIIPDRIEALTYVIMALLCGNIKINNINLLHIDSIIKLLIINGANIQIEKNALVVYKSKITPFNFETDYYPGIPTDIQPLLSVLFLYNKGNVFIKDDIFENRFSALYELQKLGAKCEINPPYAKITNSVLIGGNVVAKDLRAAAALLVCALASKCVTTIENYEIINRGYAHIYDNLKNLGAKFENETVLLE